MPTASVSPRDARSEAIASFLSLARKRGFVTVQQALRAIGEVAVDDGIEGAAYTTADIMAAAELLLDAEDPLGIGELCLRLRVPIGGPALARVAA